MPETTLLGYRVDLQLVQKSDAEFICGLRSNLKLNRYLSRSASNVTAQEAWIESYKIREELGQEFYFIISTKQQEPCGVVRIYDVQEEHFTWGSWMLADNKPKKAALDSAILVYEFGFNTLNLPKSVFQVDINNLHTIKFHQRFGALLIENDGKNMNFEYHREQFIKEFPSMKLALQDSSNAI